MPTVRGSSGFFRFEHKADALLSRALFIRRLLNHLLLAMCLVAPVLALGVLGYHGFENFSWIDSLLNASMILGGMGPVGQLQTTGGKLFASFYALFSGLVIIAIAGVLIAPIVHRTLHRFHLEETARLKKHQE